MTLQTDPRCKGGAKGGKQVISQEKVSENMIMEKMEAGEGQRVGQDDSLP